MPESTRARSVVAPRTVARTSGRPTTPPSTAWPTSCCRPSSPSSAATGLGELEVREGAWRVRLRRPGDDGRRERRRRGRRPGDRERSRPRRSRRGRGTAARRDRGHDRRSVPVGDGALTARQRRQPTGDEPRRTDRLGRRPRRPSGIFQPRADARAGTRVRAGDRLGAVDMLGVPQEVVAPADGVVGASLVEAGDAVEYGQELIVIELAVAPAARCGGLRCSARSSSPTAARSRCGSCGPAGRSASRRSSPTARPTANRCRSSSPTRRSASARPTPAGRTSRRRRSSRAALVTGCDAIHPGYGFLSEDEGFAEVVRGPRPDVHRAAGRRPRAVRQQGGRPAGCSAPTACRRSPARTACSATTMHALDEAERIGYPVLIKPSAGGGGKGMRMVRTAARARVGAHASAAPRRRPRSATTRSTSRSGSTRTATSRSRSRSTATATASTSASATARSSAATRRSSRRRPRRRCRTAARADLAERAIRAVVAAGYENVGTLEFLVDADGNFYFIEINCRIQVEHPVTEMLTGIDLVATQIRIAAGEPLGFSQADVDVPRPRHRVPDQRRGPGARVPARAPASSSATSRRAARASGWTRTCTAGYEVPPYYDSLLGKLIVWGPDRATAIARVAGRPRRAGRRRRSSPTSRSTRRCSPTRRSSTGG